MSIYNIYCDENCHLEYDKSDIMVLGAIMCPKELVHQISKDIRSIKVKHGISPYCEIKWTKVSISKLDFYKEIVDYFFNNKELRFRALVATGKSTLTNEQHNQTYDEWYYKMYYLLLLKMLDPLECYNVYIDIKDTNGGSKVEKLQTILNNSFNYINKECVRKIQIVRSHELELLGLCDLLIGAISYKNRFLRIEKIENSGVLSSAKIAICNQIMKRSGLSLEHKTSISDTKFNLFVWEPTK